MRLCFHCIAGLMVEVIADQSQRTVERALIHNTGLRPHRRQTGSYLQTVLLEARNCTTGDCNPHGPAADTGAR